ncbi:MAG: sugar transferase, partial [Bacteroidales bacterium]|nr:sugar transferase [Bacteroidales bacterium]
LIISKRTLNKIRHLNTFLGRANEVLEAGGYFWCFVRTAALKRELLMRAYPKGINYVICLLHWFWHRFCAKMPLLRNIYFGITQGRDRSYSRVEVLGRMYRAGFEVIDESFRHGRLFVLCRKSKAPIWDVEPSCGPLIKLARVGKGGRIINVYKFRTMYSYSEYLQPYVYSHEGLQDGGKFKHDYRVTLWGRFMRRTWLDELPMIINFFKGQLKLVGVRPLSRHYFSLYTPEMQALRIKVKPGLLPPFYYEKETPKTLEDVMESEHRYLDAYLAHPLRTDLRYLRGSIANILFRHKSSN